MIWNPQLWALWLEKSLQTYIYIMMSKMSKFRIQIPHHYKKTNECNCLFKYMSMPKYIMTT